MTRINLAITTQQLNVKEREKPIQQNWNALKQNKIVNEEVDKLLTNNSIRAMQYPQ